MSQAIEEARLAAAMGEVPIGAVVVNAGRIIAWAHNRRETDNDPTAHAEILAIKSTAKQLGTWRLSGCTIYVTLEPCAMCAGAIVNARVSRLVFGPYDPKAGAMGSLYNLGSDPRLNHEVEITPLVLEEISSNLLGEFFQMLRSH